MSCMDYRVNNIPVVPLQQMGGAGYPYGTSGNQMMQYQMPAISQGMNQTPQMQQMPAGAQMPSVAQMPMQEMLQPAIPPVVMDTQYTQGYLKTQIGSKVKVEFLIGTNMLVDREGTLVDVGVSYIIIIETETDDLLLCDIYSIKFVRFYR
ncbi:hypothetical protein [Lutispora saccharofermentans]|uniref:Spore coat protein GerQ n=1 Tax=Lutispora saccharofermentans TaxID=3024236 RepID=A0ABT1NIC5_9FIRM|nr:hypothetical protein [Lutispora saccharofermentans]MCQ1530329.1 hypothetical protein [Lutispora saccharofermentans]